MEVRKAYKDRNEGRHIRTTNLDEKDGNVGLAGAGAQVHDDVVILGLLQQLQLHVVLAVIVAYNVFIGTRGHE